MRAQVRRIKELTREANALERELLLVRGLQPRELELPGIGTLTASELIAEIAGIERFRSQAKLASLKRHLVRTVFNTMTPTATPLDSELALT